MRLTKICAVAGLAFSLIGAPAAYAATATASVIVTATVLSVCTIAALPLAFGNYSPAAALNGTTTLTVACTVSLPYNIGLDAGTGSGGSTTTRRMSNGSSTLNYKLFSDASRSVNIGQTIGTDTIVGTGNGLAQTITIYGQVLANQFITPGVYTDTVTATITY